MKKACTFCSTEIPTIPSLGHRINLNCIKCGHYEFTDSAEAVFINNFRDDEHKKRLMKGWILDQNRTGIIPAKIDTYNLEAIVNTTLPLIHERAGRILLECLKEPIRLGAELEGEINRLVSASYSFDKDEVWYLVIYLEDNGFIENVTDTDFGNITDIGFEWYERLKNDLLKPIQCFVAMCFDPCMNNIFDEGISPAITDVGYEPVRVDRTEHINRIDDEIMLRIQQANFVIADFTGNREGVYFEAGYALGLGKPVFWTCREDYMHKLHFDIRQYNCLKWDDLKDLRNRLGTRIEAILGRGPVKP